MAGKQRSRVRNEVVRCPNCGDDYSVTYKYCPFCDESAARGTGGRGGKRLNTRGGGYGGRRWGALRVITTVLSVALIVAAVYIVVTIVKPLVELGGGRPGSTVSPAVPASLEPSLSRLRSLPRSHRPSQLRRLRSSPPRNPRPLPRRGKLHLNASDFTLARPGETYRIRATFSPRARPAPSPGPACNPASVHVAADGTVTALANGNSTITAKLESGYSKTCIVRCSWSGKRYISHAGHRKRPCHQSHRYYPAQQGGSLYLKVTGTSAAPTWTSSNTRSPPYLRTAK